MSTREHRVEVRLGDVGHTWIEKLRRDFDTTRADVVRACLVVAARHKHEVVTYLQTVKEID